MRRVLVLALMVTPFCTTPAWSARFKVGDRIQIQTTKDIGTVTAVSAKGNCSIRMDDRPNDPQGSYFEKSPDLQLYAGGAAPPAAVGQINQPVNIGAVPGRAMPEQAPPGGAPAPWVKMQPVGGNLTEAIVKKMIEDNQNSPINHQFEKMTFVWNGVQIAGPQKIDDINLSFQNIAPGTLVYPVRADYNYTTQSINYAKNVEIVDRIAYAYFYKDDFGKWAYTLYAHAGQLNKGRYK